MCAIMVIPCARNICTYQFLFDMESNICDYKQLRYELPKNCVYSYVLGEINECNTITLTNKDTY